MGTTKEALQKELPEILENVTSERFDLVIAMIETESRSPV
jgi:hypothetical protein